MTSWDCPMCRETNPPSSHICKRCGFDCVRNRPPTAAKGSETGRKEISLYRIEEAARKKALGQAYERLKALVQEVDVAGREGVMWSDIDCLFAELRGER